MAASRTFVRSLSASHRNARVAVAACRNATARPFASYAPKAAARGPPGPPSDDKADPAHAFLGTTKRLSEFNLTDKIVLVSGAARGLGLTQTEALLEAGATGRSLGLLLSTWKILRVVRSVYALDRLPQPSDAFAPIAERAAKELGTSLHYRQIDVRDVVGLNKVIGEIGDKHGRLDGLIAAAGIQQETTALEYTQEDADRMFGVNITGVFMTAQAAAKQMIKFGNGGSIVMIASMSGTVANRVSELFARNPRGRLTEHS